MEIGRDVSLAVFFAAAVQHDIGRTHSSCPAMPSKTHFRDRVPVRA
jgi:hypothetical protein